jgi:hypothetical protein
MARIAAVARSCTVKFDLLLGPEAGALPAAAMVDM